MCLSSAVLCKSSTCDLADLPHVSQALLFLQVLPAGASKGKGVDQLLKHLDVQPERVLAMGDGENDKVMLQVLAPVLVASSSICCKSLLVCARVMSGACLLPHAMSLLDHVSKYVA